MQQMTFMECVKHAWASAAAAVRQMPLLVLLTWALYAALGWLAVLGRPGPGEPAWPNVGLVVLGNLASLLNSLVYLAFSVKIYRFVLLQERTLPLLPLGGRPVLRTIAVGLGLTLALIATAALLYFVLRPHYAGGIGFLGALIGLAWLGVTIRLSLLFPALALGGPIAPGAAWQDSRGHFWSLFGVSAVAMLPLVVCGIVFLLAAGPLLRPTPELLESPGRLAAIVILQSLANIVFVLISTTTLAWLYRRYADRLARTV